MLLPKFFKPILWFSNFNDISLEKDRELVLFQSLEKGRMEHLNFLFDKLGTRAVYTFAKKNAGRFSRKSILPFIRLIAQKGKK